MKAELAQSGLAQIDGQVGTSSGRSDAGFEFDEMEEGDEGEGVERESTDEREPGNEVMEEVLFLSRRAGGEHHFLGSASGIPFANLVSTTVEVTSRSQRRGEGDIAVEIQPVPSLVSSTPSSSTPFESSFLPPERAARDLHRAYFENDHLSYPFLHRASALAAVDEAYNDPLFFERDVFSSFVFDMILAIATASVHKFDLEALPNAEGFQLRAAQKLNQVLQRGNVQALQAILLLGQYRMINSIQDTSSSTWSIPQIIICNPLTSSGMWHIVGIAARMCLELGLHREQVYRIPQESSPHEVSTIQIKNEIQRRCFWCVVAMDR